MQAQPRVCLLRHQFAPHQRCRQFPTMMMLRSQITPSWRRCCPRFARRRPSRPPTATPSARAPSGRRAPRDSQHPEGRREPPLWLAQASKLAPAHALCGTILATILPLRPREGRCGANPPGRDGSEMHQPILGLDTAPRPLRLMVCACLDRPWSLLPAEPRVRPLVGHFRLAPQGT